MLSLRFMMVLTIYAVSESVSTRTPLPARMSSSILTDGKLKPGIYRIQNLAGQTFVEMQEGPRQLCCRPEAVLSSRDGLVRSIRPLITQVSVSNVCTVRLFGGL